MKASYTRKLFYKKFPYKASIVTPETGFIRYAHRKDIERLFSADKFEEWSGARLGYSDPYASYVRSFDLQNRRNSNIWKNRFKLYNLYVWVNDAQEEYKDELAIRNEGSKFSIFTSDKDLWDNFVKTFSDDVREIVWPKNDAHKQYLLENPNTVICKELPFGSYRYKINLKSRLQDSLRGISEWINNYDGDLKVAESLLKDLEQGYGYLENRGFYATDSSMLTLIQMYLGGNVKDVTKYITDDELDARSAK